MFAALLIQFGITRDSLVLLWSRIVSVALIVAGGTLPLDRYLSPAWVHGLMTAAFVVLVLSGHYGTSPLPGKKEL